MRTFFSIAMLALACGTAHADLVITEVMSSSGHPGGPVNGDWWELTNTGSTGVNLENYYWDDDGPSGADGALFPSISIGAGEAIVIVNEDTADTIDFVTNWGGGFVAISEEAFVNSDDSFSGLSSSGDMIQLWDANPNVVPGANLVAEVTFGAATEGVSFEWDRFGNSLGLSAVGENGAFVATGDGAAGAGTDVGSPGFSAVPEPSSMVVLLAFATGAVARRRRRTNT